MMGWNENEHVSEQTLRLFCQNRLSAEECLCVAEHISECEQCAEALASCMEQVQRIHVPLGFQETVLLKVGTPKNEKKQFVFYSLRVGLAVCAALVIIFSGLLNFMFKAESNVSVSNSHIVDQINTKLQDFNPNIFKWEVFHHEKKEK